jgi:glutamyl-Q tRNA(Asp) synthetase
VAVVIADDHNRPTARDVDGSPPTAATLRFAPSPNGPLHAGHALSARIGFEFARRLGGRFLVRIEDIDTTRSRPELVTALLADLDWLGIDYERPVLRQSEHFDVYRAAARRLESLGVLYPCFATRAEIARAAVPGAVDPDGAPLYPGSWRNAAAAEVAARRAAGEPFALRLDMARALSMVHDRLDGAPLTFDELSIDGRVERVTCRPERWGDAVLVRKETPTSYHLSVVVDDARQGVTHVTRGTDLFAATDLHRVLQVLLGLPQPLYHHHCLVEGSDGRKLAKREGAPGLAELRARGLTAEALLARLDVAAHVPRAPATSHPFGDAL